MIRFDEDSLGPIPKLALLGLLVVGLAASTVLAQTSGTWVTTGSLSTGRLGHTATLLPNGEVLVVGGIGNVNPQSPRTATAELYNPATGKWQATGSMNTAHFSQGMALLQNGQVLVAGGDICWGFSGGASPGASAELYDPTSGN